MTYVTDVQDNLTKEIVTFVELELDYCPLVYGSANCGATGAIGQECYQTFQTCHNVVDATSPATVGYTGSNGVNQTPRPTKKYYFFQPSQRSADYTSGFPDVVYHSLSSIGDVPTQIDRDKGLGRRSSVTAKFNDFADDDSDVDPNAATRPYNTNQGSFWGKWLARNNQAYYGRPLRVYKGVKKDVFDFDDFEVQEYIIQQVDRDAKGNVTIKANDPLFVLNDARLPIVSKSKLIANTLSTATTITTSNTTEILEQLKEAFGVAGSYVSGTKYSLSVDEHVRIGSEIIGFKDFQEVAGNIDLTTLTRGAKGTPAEDASLGDEVQMCYTYLDNPVQVIYDMLSQYINTDFIDYTEGGGGAVTDETDWEYQRFLYANLASSSNVISKPTKVYELTAALASQYNLYLWWDDRTQKVRLKALAPPVTEAEVKSFTSEQHIIEESVVTKNDLKTQATQVHVYYNRIDFTEDKKESNYRKLIVYVDPDSESSYSFDRSKAEVIFADNILADSDADSLAARKLGLLSKGDRRHTFTLASENADVWVGDYVSIGTFDIQSPTGSSRTEQLEVLSAKFVAHDRIQFEASASFLNTLVEGIRFFYWAAGGIGEAGTSVGGTPIATWADDDCEEVESDGTTKVLVDGSPVQGWSWF